VLTDGYGEIYEHLEFFAFGETWVGERATSNSTPYLYTSKELDETGLYYYGARYMDPRTSLWVSVDPALEKYLPVMPGDEEELAQLQRDPLGYWQQKLPGTGGVFNAPNLGVYSYSHQNPVKLRDPDGNVAVIPVLLIAWAVVETGLAIYDVYTAGTTIVDPGSTNLEKSLAVGGLALSIILPGGGYGTIGKQIATKTLRFTESGIQHSWKHAAQWFGREVPASTHMSQWKSILEKASQSTKLFLSKSGGTETIAQLARIDGKYLILHYSKETGEFLTASVPSNRQLDYALKALGIVE
jgi:RHS repeat-associated protein